MRGLLAQLSPNEEVALLKVGLGSSAQLASEHIRRLLQLDLIEWNSWRWTLTVTGQRRYDAMISKEVANQTDA